MSYRITECYLPPDRGDIPAFTPAEAGTRLSEPGGMQGCVDLVGFLRMRWYTRPKTVTHPSTNRARRALTSFMRRTPLTTTPRRRPASFINSSVSPLSSSSSSSYIRLFRSCQAQLKQNTNSSIAPVHTRTFAIFKIDNLQYLVMM